jgi:rhodanese-related sulfurtransferase
MKEISVSELREMRENKEDIQLVDVREQYEYDEMNLGGELIPMAEALERMNEISRVKKVVIHCRSGKRSAAVIHALESQAGYDNLYNLQGGIIAWVEAYGI